jgi:SAM-dependent methyltransferase
MVSSGGENMFNEVIIKLLKPLINENPFIYELDSKLDFFNFLRGKTKGKLYCGERVVEYPFVFRNLPPKCSVFELGASKSALSFTLACLGYRVTALDVRNYEFTHPNLEFIKKDFFDFESDKKFDCVVAVSTIEHVGFGHYGDSNRVNDLKVMEKIKRLLRPDGVLLLTTHFGRYHVGSWFKVYDSEHLDELLDGFRVEVIEFYKRLNGYIWLPSTKEELEEKDCSKPKHGVDGIVCVRCRI